MRAVKDVLRRTKRTGACQEARRRGSTGPTLAPNPPIAARVTWRLFELGNGQGSFDLVHTETAFNERP
jgi:hypothetical protein